MKVVCQANFFGLDEIESYSEIDVGLNEARDDNSPLFFVLDLFEVLELLKHQVWQQHCPVNIVRFDLKIDWIDKPLEYVGINPLDGLMRAFIDQLKPWDKIS